MFDSLDPVRWMEAVGIFLREWPVFARIFVYAAIGTGVTRWALVPLIRALRGR